MEKNGSIMLCNETFEYFVNETLKIKSKLRDFYKLIKADEKDSRKFANTMNLE
jgi:hypothetical protein